MDKDEEPPRVVVKRYRKATPHSIAHAPQPSTAQQHTVTATSTPHLMQSKPRFGPGHAPPRFTISPYPLPATLRTQTHTTAHWHDRLQPHEATCRPKLPPFAKGPPLAPPLNITANRPRCNIPDLRTGGRPLPKPRPTPRSLLFRYPGIAPQSATSTSYTQLRSDPPQVPRSTTADTNRSGYTARGAALSGTRQRTGTNDHKGTQCCSPQACRTDFH